MDELILLSFAYVVFTLMIVVEAACSYAWGRGYYRVGEAVSNISHGLAYQTLDVFTKVWVMVPFVLLSSYAPVQLSMDSAVAWIVGVVAYDFCTYWAHRNHHEVGFLWAIHGVHHAAEDFNLAAALRQPLIQQTFKWLWTLPLALFMPVPMFVGIVVFDFLYQFVQHTRFVGRLGPLEWVMNTPSHHRVHHGIQEKYLDKNYGGIFIVWDRLFGTFQVEEEAPEYGVTKPVNALNLVWGNGMFFADLVSASLRAERWQDKLWLWIAGPGQIDRLAPGAAALVRQPVEDNQLTRRTKVYAIGSAVAVTLAVAVLILWGVSEGAAVQAGLTGFVVMSLLAIGAALDRHRWFIPIGAMQVSVAVALGAAFLVM